MPAVATSGQLAALRGWLLSDRVLVRAGRGRVAVAGSVDARGRPAYYYPEVAGYFLWWLADPAADVPTAERSCVAEGVIAWLADLGRGARWPTRVEAGADRPVADDWRNATVFSFDLAMLLRGLAAVDAAGVAEVPASVVARLYAELARCVTADGRLAAHATTDESLPRWSTRPGPYQLKAAAALGPSAERWPMPAPLDAAVCRVRREFGALGERPGHHELHPALYHAEGALLGDDPSVLEAVRTWWRGVMRLGDRRGGVPETVGSARHRSDVWAQALRIGRWLERGGALEPRDAPALRALTVALAAMVAPDGGLRFRPTGEPSECPVWGALFAEQALRWESQDEVDPRWLI